MLRVLMGETLSLPDRIAALVLVVAIAGVSVWILLRRRHYARPDHH